MSLRDLAGYWLFAVPKSRFSLGEMTFSEADFFVRRRRCCPERRQAEQVIKVGSQVQRWTTGCGFREAAILWTSRHRFFGFPFPMESVRANPEL